jgi:TolB-like protein/Tfp pilus assembly protein PilF
MQEYLTVLIKLGLSEKDATGVFFYAYPTKPFRGAIRFEDDDLPLGSHSAQLEAQSRKRHSPRGKNRSIAVMAFEYPDGKRILRTIADGIADGIITKLSSSDLLVVSRMASFSYRGRSVNHEVVARELNVGFIVTGRISSSDKQIRISAQLVDAANGHNVWGEQYDKTFRRNTRDVLAIEDEIAAHVVQSLRLHFGGDGVKGESHMSANMEVWESLIRAQILVDRRTKTDLEVASELTRRSIGIDPEDATAHAMLSYITMLRLHYAWLSRDVANKDGLEHARAAIKLNPREPWGQIAMGFVRLHAKSVSEAAECFQRAIALNRNLAFAYIGYGAALCYLGQGKKALSQIDSADRLNPPTRFARGDLGTNLNVRASACFVLKWYEKGIVYAEKTIKVSPELLGGYRNLVVNSALAGKIDRSQEALESLRNRQKESLSLNWISGWLPYVRANDRERYLDAFRLAGLK